MQDVLAAQFCASYWPVTLELLAQHGAERKYDHFVPGAVFQLDEVTVRTLALASIPAAARGIGWKSPAWAWSSSPPITNRRRSPIPMWSSFSMGPPCCLADMQYRDGEYRGEAAIGGDFGQAMSREGWGHATPERLLPMLLRCPRLPQRVRIVHHDPKRPDTDLQLFSDESTALLEDWSDGTAMDFQFAREGEIFWL